MIFFTQETNIGDFIVPRSVEQEIGWEREEKCLSWRRQERENGGEQEGIWDIGGGKWALVKCIGHCMTETKP